jgi:hypothetical protein
MTPTGGLIDHVTAPFVEPLTVAAKCVVWPPPSDAVAGLTLTPTGPPGKLSKKMPLTTALAPDVRAILILTWPDSVHTKY